MSQVIVIMAFFAAARGVGTTNDNVHKLLCLLLTFLKVLI
jgi:hypothetical protein